MINKPTKLIVLTIILSTAIAVSDNVYGAEPPLQGDEILKNKKKKLTLYYLIQS